LQEAGSTEDVPACFSFGIVLFINAAIWRKKTMEFFNQAITVLQTLVVAIGAGLGVWGVVNLMEGYGNDNPGAKSQGMKHFIPPLYYSMLLRTTDFFALVPSF
jgi:hypothetical protein